MDVLNSEHWQKIQGGATSRTPDQALDRGLRQTLRPAWNWFDPDDRFDFTPIGIGATDSITKI